MCENVVEPDRVQMTILQIACTLHAEKPMLQIRTHNMLSHGKNGYANALQCYVLPTCPLVNINLLKPTGHVMHQQF